MSGGLHRDALIITCSEPDALPFLLSLPPACLEQTALIATGDVVRSADQRTTAAATHVLGGPSTLDGARTLLDGLPGRAAVVVAPDPWGPVHGKGFVRARLLAPWVLPVDGKVDLIELKKGGLSHRTLAGLSRCALARRLYVRETLLLLQYFVDPGAAVPAGPLGIALKLPRALMGAVLALPLALVTLARVLPFILKTEARAARMGRQL